MNSSPVHVEDEVPDPFGSSPALSPTIDSDVPSPLTSPTLNVNKDVPPPPASDQGEEDDEDEDEDEELPDLYLPSLILPAMFLPIPNVRTYVHIKSAIFHCILDGSIGHSPQQIYLSTGKTTSKRFIS